MSIDSGTGEFTPYVSSPSELPKKASLSVPEVVYVQLTDPLASAVLVTEPTRDLPSE
jgi:hypothetical protein